MSARLVNVDRATPMLWPPDLREWVAEDDMVHFVIEAVGEAFLHVLQRAREMGVLKVGTVSIDGTHVRANASKDQNVRYDRCGELEQQLRKDIQLLLDQAEQTDQQEQADGQSLPQQIARRQQLLAKLEQARERLERRAQERAKSEQAEYERKVGARDQRNGSRK
ncbi:MAG TPA: hypothetical protein VMZ31_03850, partial [Phycisphaerae bacterium]|nr:hypothetical protein [Phycisphaerae bacterium]